MIAWQSNKRSKIVKYAVGKFPVSIMQDAEQCDQIKIAKCL